MGIRRKKIDGGIQQPDKLSTMSPHAVDIAVSEITGISLDRLCNYVLIALEHLDDPGGAHMMNLSCKDNDYSAALGLAEHGLVDLRQIVEAER